MGEAQPARSRSRSGIRRSASSATSARSSVRTPPSAPRSTTRAARRSAATFKSTPTKGSSSRASATRFRSRPRTAPAATCASTSARPRTGPTRSTRRSTCSRRRRCATPSATTTISSSTCPRLARTRCDDGSITRGRSSSSRCSSTRGPAPGCGETPYIKLLTQLFGDRLLIANATGCSSIYGGNLPTTPYTTNRDGRGPAWSNSLFEDNAEFGFGLRLGVDSHMRRGARAGRAARPIGWATRSRRSCSAPTRRGSGDRGAARAGARAAARSSPLWIAPEARRLEALADYLVKKSVWLRGRRRLGLRHRLRRPRPRAGQPPRRQHPRARHRGLLEHRRPAIEGDAARRRRQVRRQPARRSQKKDLGLLANMYGHVYVARVAFGAKMAQTVQAFLEAEAYPGPSLIIAYSHCIAHGYDMAHGAAQQKLAVDSGVWPLYRFDPRRIAKGEPPLHLDYGPPKARVADYMRNESRFRVVERTDPARFKRFLKEAQEAAPTALRGLPAARGHHRAPGRGQGRRRRRLEAGRSRRSTHGPQHDLSRDEAAASARPGRVTAERRPRRRQAARRRGRRGDRPAIALRRADHARADATHNHRTATANRSPRPPLSFRAPTPSRSGRTSTWSTCGG